MGWICGEDIDVTIDEGNKNTAEEQEEEEEEEVPLDVQIGKGETMHKKEIKCVFTHWGSSGWQCLSCRWHEATRSIAGYLGGVEILLVTSCY